MVIPFSVIVTLARPAAADIDAISTIRERPEYKIRVYPAGTHEPDDPDVSGILKTRDPT